MYVCVHVCVCVCVCVCMCVCGGNQSFVRTPPRSVKGVRHQWHGHMPFRPGNLRHRLGQLQDLGNSQTRQPFAPAASDAPSSI